MTLMQFFDIDDSAVSVTCTADLNLPNTDMMMVLDTTLVDGQKDTRPFTYSAWGIAATARRRTPTGVFPSRALEDAVSESRLAELCEIAKNEKNITLWVIAFGTNLDQLLTSCASPGRAFEARNAQELTQTFAQIATQLAELRLTN